MLSVGVLALAGLLWGPGRFITPAAAATTDGPTVSVTLTTRSLSRALSPRPALHFTTSAGSLPTLHVNDAAPEQSVLGFGGAMTDSAAWLLYDELTPQQRATMMQALFSDTAGIDLDLIRVPIGASDFSAHGTPYTYDDLPAGQSDPLLLRFSIAHDQAYVIPTLREMLSIDPSIRVLSTEWSPPAWMKTNDALGNLANSGRLNAGDYETLALYFARFIEAYQAAGVPIWGVTPENEPLAPAPYPGLSLTPAQEGAFVAANLTPTLRLLGLHQLVFGGDQVSHLAYGQQLMQTSAAAELSGMAWHCYGGLGVLSRFHALYPRVPELMSECSPGIVPYAPAEAAIDALRNYASGVDLWNLALDPDGGPVQPPNSGCENCTGLLTVNETTHTARLTSAYYQLGQLSKFIQPGAVVLGTERWVSDYSNTGRADGQPYGVSNGIDDVAVVNPGGEHVLVAYNNSSRTRSFAVSDGGMAFSYRLPGGATVSFSWNP